MLSVQVIEASGDAASEPLPTAIDGVQLVAEFIIFDQFGDPRTPNGLLGHRIRNTRAAHGLTQRELAGLARVPQARLVWIE